MGKYQDLFRNVSLGIAACYTDEICPSCPYDAYPQGECKIRLETDKLAMCRLMTHLDKMNEEVKE